MLAAAAAAETETEDTAAAPETETEEAVAAAETETEEAVAAAETETEEAVTAAVATVMAVPSRRLWFGLVRIRPLRSVLTISEPWDEGDGFE